VVREFDAESRREQILGCAMQAFAMDGFDAARTADIAARAGVSERLLYKHFAGKRELFLAVVEQVVDLVVDGYRQSMNSDMNLRDGIRWHFEQRFGPGAPGATQPLFFGRTHGPFEDPAMSDAIARGTRQMIDAGAEYFASLAEKGELRPGVDPTAAAWMLGAIFRDHDSLRAAYGPKRATAVAENVIQQFIDGIAASPAD
jgi:AcrR family transcriptional regulator